jgi:long-subunit acyl-CoA synthetase (AMP-forming)
MARIMTTSKAWTNKTTRSLQGTLGENRPLWVVGTPKLWKTKQTKQAKQANNETKTKTRAFTFTFGLAFKILSESPTYIFNLA